MRNQLLSTLTPSPSPLSMTKDWVSNHEEHLTYVRERLASKRQTVMFSATMPKALEDKLEATWRDTASQEGVEALLPTQRIMIGGDQDSDSDTLEPIQTNSSSVSPSACHTIDATNAKTYAFVSPHSTINIGWNEMRNQLLSTLTPSPSPYYQQPAVEDANQSSTNYY